MGRACVQGKQNSVLTLLSQCDCEDNTRVGKGMVNMNTMVGLLWHVARLTTKVLGERRLLVAEVAYQLIMFLSHRIAAWFLQQPEATTL